MPSPEEPIVKPMELAKLVPTITPAEFWTEELLLDSRIVMPSTTLPVLVSVLILSPATKTPIVSTQLTLVVVRIVKPANNVSTALLATLLALAAVPMVVKPPTNLTATKLLVCAFLLATTTPSALVLKEPTAWITVFA
jgi:hypothetical protein